MVYWSGQAISPVNSPRHSPPVYWFRVLGSMESDAGCSVYKLGLAMLERALGGMIRLPQWFTWRLTWDAVKGKYKKAPCLPNGGPWDEQGEFKGMDAQSPGNWLPYQIAVANTQALTARNDGHVYALGFMLTKASGYWFLDMDSCVENGQPNALVNEFFAFLPGALFEFSSSQRGVHLIGRGAVPRHSNKHNPLGLEFYTERRGICFGLTGQAWGCADTELSVQAAAIAEHYFPPREDVADVLAGSGPRGDWNGPTDDGELIRRAMASASDASKLGGKATFADLWTRNIPKLAATYPPSDDEPFGESEADAALAAHLAFWTGCDLDRMVRLMKLSALVRPKWTEHRTYLRELTCAGAVGRCRDVLQDRERHHALPVTVTPEQQVVNRDYMAALYAADEAELRNEVVPAIAADRTIEALDRDRLAAVVQERLKSFMIPASIGDCRRMVRCVADDDADAMVPMWANEHVYVQSGDFFHHLRTGQQLSRSAFNATYNRMMPERNAQGDKEEAARWALERWNMSTVADTVYRPDKDMVFQAPDGRWYANEFTPASIPDEQEFTEQGIAAINLFQRHLWAFCSGRQMVFETLLSWMAHNVQHPGKKIRWAPLLKGIQGDGKSILLDVMAAAMGHRNATKVNLKAIMSEFNDWAGGSAVSGIEELMLTGSKRYAVANSLKEVIGNTIINLNRKGRVGLSIYNVTNYAAFTNFVDAVPLEDTDRRWFIVFSPYHQISDQWKALGDGSESSCAAIWSTIFNSLDREPGQWRKWLRSLQIAFHFNPNGHAPKTDEKAEMRVSGEDSHEGIARQVIETGAPGVSPLVICSASLTRAMQTLCVADGMEMPKTSSVNHLLARLGYSKWTEVVWWDGKARRVWWKRGALRTPGKQAIRDILDQSVRDDLERRASSQALPHLTST